MLVGSNLVQPKNLPFRHLRKRPAFAVVVLFVFLAIGDRCGHLIDAEVAVEFLDGAGSPESVVAGGNVDGRLIEDRRKHLRGNKALPDELVKLEKVFVEILADVFRRAHGVGGTHRFVGFLRILLRFVIVGLFRKIVRAKAFGDQLTNLDQRVVRNMYGIGAHVGDQRDRAFVTKLHALIKFLRQGHGALGGIAQPVVSRLLQFGSRERRRRIALLFFLRDAGDLPFGLAHRSDNLVRALLV